MEIKHNLTLEEVEVKTLYDIIATPALMTYGSTIMQETAMAAAKHEFENSLTTLVQKAFKIGCKVGKAKADIKDKKMYEA